MFVGRGRRRGGGTSPGLVGVGEGAHLTGCLAGCTRLLHSQSLDLGSSSYTRVVEELMCDFHAYFFFFFSHSIL